MAESSPSTVVYLGPQGRQWRRFWVHSGLVVGAAVMVYPLFWLLVSSVKRSQEIFTDTAGLPSVLKLSNYSDGWAGPGTVFGHFLLNSLAVSVGAAVGNIVACSMTAYAFARLDFRFKRTCFALMLGCIMLPKHAILIPQYVLFFKLGWVNTFAPLIAPKFLATDAFFVFLMVQFIRGLPRELDDAAKVDGCGPYLLYLRIILPLLRPAIAVTGLFTFIWTYDDFFSQLIYLSSTTLYTVPLGLRLFLASTGQSSYGPLLAMSVVSITPVFLLFLAFQRLLVEGISTTGLKG